MNVDRDIDARGLLCPLPVLRARKALMGLPPGGVVRLWADDPAAWVDVPHFCAEAGYHLVSAASDGAAGNAFVIAVPEAKDP